MKIDIAPLLDLEDKIWDSNIVEYRTMRILEVVWDRINTWLS